jgi:CDP-diacylglycerol--serine O-phosphatidyltransferase
VLVVLFFAFLIAYPWWVLTIGTVIYLACLPLGLHSYRGYQRRDAAAAAQQATTPVISAASGEAPPLSPAQSDPPAEPDRPRRLN